MAGDTVRLIEALGVDSAHLVGASMGGMIGQVLAIEHPDRVRSLTSIMSTTGDPTSASPREAFAELARPAARTREEMIARRLQSHRVVGSPDFPTSDTELRDRAGQAFDRNFDPNGGMRQFAAALASPDRTADLAGVRVPTLVIHGADDPLIQVSGGHGTAAAIPDAELHDHQRHGPRPSPPAMAASHRAHFGPHRKRRAPAPLGLTYQARVAPSVEKR